MKTCEKCGVQMEYKRDSKKYCSDECRRLVKYERDRAWLLARPGKNAEYSRKWRENNPEAAREAARYAYKKKCMLKMESEGT